MSRHLLPEPNEPDAEINLFRLSTPAIAIVITLDTKTRDADFALCEVASRVVSGIVQPLGFAAHPLRLLRRRPVLPEALMFWSTLEFAWRGHRAIAVRAHGLGAGEELTKEHERIRQSRATWAELQNWLASSAWYAEEGGCVVRWRAAIARRRANRLRGEMTRVRRSESIADKCLRWLMQCAMIGVT